MTAGIIAALMGLPVREMLMATNEVGVLWFVLWCLRTVWAGEDGGWRCV